MGTWGSKTSATQLTTISDTIQWFDETPQCDVDEILHVEVECNFAATPTDDLSIHIRRSLDATSENWDDHDYMSLVIPNTVDPGKVSFDLGPGYKYRVGVQSTGATDDHTSADMSYSLGAV